LGVLFIHDRIGITNQTGSYFSYAYRIPLNKKGKLSFGLQGGVNYYNIRYSEINDPNPAFSIGDVQEIRPNAGFGMFYNTDRFYMGFSIPQLIETQGGGDNVTFQSVRHYFYTIGRVFDLNPNLKLKPNILVKAVAGAPIEIDINMNLLIKEVLWVGTSWRSMDSFDGIIQFQLSNQFQLGYAYDFLTTSDLNRVMSGSHEIMLNYRFVKSKAKVITPRYF